MPAAACIPTGRIAVLVYVLAVAWLTVAVRADEPARPSSYTETIPGSDVRFEMVGILLANSLKAGKRLS